MLGEISIGIVIGAGLMAWLLRSILRSNMQRWEEEIKQKGIEEYNKISPP